MGGVRSFLYVIDQFSDFGIRISFGFRRSGFGFWIRVVVCVMKCPDFKAPPIDSQRLFRPFALNNSNCGSLRKSYFLRILIVWSKSDF
jgi:hypothetical protein